MFQGARIERDRKMAYKEQLQKERQAHDDARSSLARSEEELRKLHQQCRALEALLASQGAPPNGSGLSPETFSTSSGHQEEQRASAGPPPTSPGCAQGASSTCSPPASGGPSASKVSRARSVYGVGLLVLRQRKPG